MVLRCCPGECLVLHGVLLHAVTSLLLMIMMMRRVVTLPHSPAFGELFVIKLVGEHGLQVLSRTMLEENILAVSC